MNKNRIPAIQQPVTEASARAWFEAMELAGIAYNPDDDAATIGNIIDGELVKLFNDTEAAAANTITESMRAAGLDPCTVALAMIED